MSETLRKLDRWRLGKPGVVLFYTYLIAILVVATLAFASYSTVHDQGRELSAEIKRGEARDLRTCTAIAGAVEFWRLVRQTTNEVLRDPNLSPAERSANEHYKQALTDVIAAGEKLSCKINADGKAVGMDDHA